MEGVVGLDDNVLGLVPYKEPTGFLFSRFFLRFLLLRILQIALLQFFNSDLIKNLKMDSIFLEFLFQIFSNFKIDRPIFSKPMKSVPTVTSTEISIHALKMKVVSLVTHCV
jgi:uncharacterized membrane protein